MSGGWWCSGAVLALAVGCSSTSYDPGGGGGGEPLEPVNAVLGDVSWVDAFGEEPTAEAEESVRVATHLAYVERLLRAVDTTDWPAELRLARAKNLDRLHDYWMSGRFPLNVEGSQRVPRFADDVPSHTPDEDESVLLCAVGHLFAQDEGVEAALEIAEAHQFDSVYAIDSEHLAAWASASGLTLDELAMIQPSYDFERPRPRPEPQAAPPPSKESIQRSLATRLGEVNRCVHDRLGPRDQHPAKFVAEVSVAPSGTFASVKLSSSMEKTNLGLERCIVDAINELSFQPFRGAAVSASHAFTIVGPTKADGSLDVSYMAALMRKQLPSVRACQSFTTDTMQVDLVVDAMAQTKGKLSDVRVSIVNGPAATSFRSCVAKVFETLETAKFKGKPTPVSQAFSFRI